MIVELRGRLNLKGDQELSGAISKFSFLALKQVSVRRRVRLIERIED